MLHFSLLRGAAVVIVATAALTLGGCISRHETSDHHEICDDNSSYNPAGQVGDWCWDDSDCTDGLECDVDADVCASPPPSCNSSEDCGVGSYCDDVEGECVETNVCTDNAECGDGLTCDEELSTCVPGEEPPPACEELAEEQSCLERSDCEAVYAGVNCSCGPDCTCTGGEPGCVCEDFEFFKCDPLEENS